MGISEVLLALASSLSLLMMMMHSVEADFATSKLQIHVSAFFCCGGYNTIICPCYSCWLVGLKKYFLDTGSTSVVYHVHEKNQTRTYKTFYRVQRVPWRWYRFHNPYL